MKLTYYSFKTLHTFLPIPIKSYYFAPDVPDPCLSLPAYKSEELRCPLWSGGEVTSALSNLLYHC